MNVQILCGRAVFAFMRKLFLKDDNAVLKREEVELLSIYGTVEQNCGTELWNNGTELLKGEQFKFTDAEK